jgi:copper chaperone CopZ
MKTRKLSINTIFALIFVFAISHYSFAQNQSNIEQVNIKTSAVCKKCKEKIESNLSFEKGVKDVELNIETKIVTVKYNPDKTDPDNIRKAISKLGYDADDIKSDCKAYENLAQCCKNKSSKCAEKKASKCSEKKPSKCCKKKASKACERKAPGK